MQLLATMATLTPALFLCFILFNLFADGTNWKEKATCTMAILFLLTPLYYIWW